MPSYRFCRPDDIPFLVRAVNECFDAHFPGRPPLTVDGFRGEMKRLDLWPSNSLVAASEDTPVAVLTGTKRDDEVLVSRVGVRPGAEREGHGGHLLTSLGQKLAVLGPPRLAAEVPESLPGALAFFRALGWREEAVYLDLERPARATGVEPVPDGFVGPVTVTELDAAGVLEANGSGSGRGASSPPPAWERRPESLRGRGEELSGLAVASPDRIEAWLLYQEVGPNPGEIGRPGVDVAAWGVFDPDRTELLLPLLLRELVASADGGPVRLVRTGPDEVPEAVAASLELVPGERTHRLTAEAKAL